MSKLDALWAYQEAEMKKEQAEAAIRSTPSRVQFNKLHKLLKTQQATIAKLGEDMDAREAQLGKLLDYVKKLDDRVEMENSELATISGDEESTAEEMTELRGDVEKLGREINNAIREAKTLQGEIERAEEEYQKTRQIAGKAKKEYDALRVVCEKERDEGAAEIQKLEAEMQKAATAVEPAMLARYEKVKQHHAVPIAKVVNAKCGGCNMSLPMVMLKKLAATDAIVECENCGRILYADRA